MLENPGDDAVRPESDGRVADLLRVLEVARRLAVVADLPCLLEVVEESAARVLDCDHVDVFLSDARGDALRGRGDEARGLAEVGVVGEAFRRGVVVTDAEAAGGQPGGGVLAGPLIGWENTVVGALLAARPRGRRFDAWDEILARAIGAQAGVAIQRLLAQRREPHRPAPADLDVARQIQQALLPRCAPTVAGYDVAGWSQPADVSGGDFFDLQQRPGGRLAVAVADVSGHGLGPALVVAECRALIRATLAQTEEPDCVIAQVNALLGEDLLQDRFVTVFLGVLDAEAHRLTYVSAGHGPLLFHSRAGGGLRELAAQGCPLGVPQPRSFSPPWDVAFAPGDLLAIVTDGFFEWTDPRGHCFGVERLRDRLWRSRDRPADAIIRDLHQAVLAFSGGTPQPDDLTAVIIKRPG